MDDKPEKKAWHADLTYHFMPPKWRGAEEVEPWWLPALYVVLLLAVIWVAGQALGAIALLRQLN